MTHQFGMQERLLRLLIHPFHRAKPVSFSTSLSSAKTVLIFLPTGVQAKEAKKLLEKSETIFTGRKLLFVCNEGDKQTYGDRAIPINQEEIHILNMGKLPVISTLAGETIDLIIDLCPDPELINFYICRRFRPPVRAGLRHALSARYYNLEFTPNPAKSTGENAMDMLSFLSTAQ